MSARKTFRIVLKIILRESTETGATPRYPVFYSSPSELGAMLTGTQLRHCVIFFTHRDFHRLGRDGGRVRHSSKIHKIKGEIKIFPVFHIFKLIARFSKCDFWNLGEIWDRNNIM